MSTSTEVPSASTILTPFAQSNPLIDPIPQSGADNTNAFIDWIGGFPAITMIPIAAGGLPPRGQSFNGVLHDITTHLVRAQYGYRYTFNQEVADAGGYPFGACLYPDDSRMQYYVVSLVDNNTTNFNTESSSIGSLWQMVRLLGDYSEKLIYPVHTLSVLSTGSAYQAIQENGPDTVIGVVEPGTDENVWRPFNGSGAYDAVYEAVPDTVPLRSVGDARTQVGDPIQDLDAVNYLFMRNYVLQNGGGINVEKPVILDPPENTLMQSFAFQITVSDIELVAGGEPSPLLTRWRVMDENGLVGAYGEESYTTTPTITLPDSMVGQNFQVVVQYEDAFEGLSPWSDRWNLRLASVLLRGASVTVPANGATGVLPNGLTITTSPGRWTNGTTFSGATSQLKIYDIADNTLIYDTGVVSYATDFVVPNNTLSTSKNYWTMIQHVASAPPAANPDAILASPIYGVNDPRATKFTTIAASAPNVATLQHDIPKGVEQGIQVAIHIWGATSVDSGGITYDISSLVGGLSFSKYTGISDNEPIEMYVPTIAGTTVNAALQIVARSSFGGVSIPVNVNIIILGQTVWIYTEDATHTPPIPMIADVEVGGGGGRTVLAISGFYVGGGGGGYAKKRLQLSSSAYPVTVGKGATSATGTNGGTSSFGGIISATGGGSAVYTGETDPGPAQGGIGVGGDLNTTGGKSPSARVSGSYPNTYCVCGGGGGAGPDGNGADGKILANAVGKVAQGGVGGGGDTGTDGTDAPPATNPGWSGARGLGGKKGVAGGGAGNSTAAGSTMIGGRGSVIITFVSAV